MTGTSRASDAELARLARRVESRWYDLAMAEERGQPTHVLERMYAAYLRALDELVAAQRASAGYDTQTQLAS